MMLFKFAICRSSPLPLLISLIVILNGLILLYFIG
jgi:hypothetical protein